MAPEHRHLQTHCKIKLMAQTPSAKIEKTYVRLKFDLENRVRTQHIAAVVWRNEKRTFATKTQHNNNTMANIRSSYEHIISMMIWYDIVMWCDVMWYDDVIWYDVWWYDMMIRYMIWYDVMIWCDNLIWWSAMMWCGTMICYDKDNDKDVIWCYEMIWYGMT